MPVVTKPGTLLMSSEPFAYVGEIGIGTPTAPMDQCDECLKIYFGLDQLQHCAGCHVVTYCNRDCQKRGWRKGHKYECEGMKKHGKGEGTDPAADSTVRLLIRIIAKLQDGKDYFDEVETENGIVKRRFQDLVSHAEEIRCDEEMKGKVERWIEGAKFLLMHSSRKIELPDENELFEICGRIKINSFAIINDFITGHALYLGGSVFNHSCDPLACQIFDGVKLVTRSIKEIPEGLPLDQVTVGYGTALQPSKYRKEFLLRKYYFECKCEWCLTGLHDKAMRSIICYKKGCGAEIASEELGSPCHTCGNQLTEKEVKEIHKTEEELLYVKPTDTTLSDSEIFVEKMKQLNFSDGHWLMLRLSVKAHQSAMLRPDGYAKSYEYGQLHLKGLRRYLNPNCGEYCLVFKLMARLTLKMNKVQEAEQYLKDSKGIVKMLYGENSEYYKTHISHLEEDIEHEKIMKMLRRALTPQDWIRERGNR